MFLTKMKCAFILGREGKKRVAITRIKEFILLSSVLVFVSSCVPVGLSPQSQSPTNFAFIATNGHSSVAQVLVGSL